MPNRKFFFGEVIDLFKKNRGCFPSHLKRKKKKKKKILVLGLAAGWLVAQKKGEGN